MTLTRAIVKNAAISSERLAVGLVFAAIFVLACMAPAKGDTWWLIRTGHDIWQAGYVPVVDSYSHTIRGQPWPNHEWLSDVLFYGAYASAGMTGLTFFCATLIVIASLLSWSMTAGRFELRFAVFVLGLTTSAEAWALRPQLTTMVCLCVACWLLLARRLWWLPALHLLWANLHGGVILGLLAIGAVGLVETIRHRRIPLDLLLAGLLSAAATVATPLGFDLWRLLMSYGEGARGEGIQEWMAPSLPPANLAFWAVAAVLVGATAYRWRWFDPATARLVAIAFVLLPFALSAVRNVALFLLVAVPAVTAALSVPLAAPEPHGRRDASLGNTMVFGTAIVVALFAVGYSWWLQLDRSNWNPLSPRTIAAVAGCPGPLYNTYDDGGALTWFVPAQPVFIDSRYDPYPTALFQENHQLEATGDYQELFHRYGIRCAIVRTSTPIDLALRSNPVWAVSHSDQRHTVLVRDSGRSALPKG